MGLRAFERMSVRAERGFKNRDFEIHARFSCSVLRRGERLDVFYDTERLFVALLGVLYYLYVQIREQCQRDDQCDDYYDCCAIHVFYAFFNVSSVVGAL